jgi:hypothetical protein
MNDYIFLMHNDATAPIDPALWPPYLEALRKRGVLQGGSAIAGGETIRRHGTPAPVSHHLGGYIRITADSLEDARLSLAGNPVFESDGTVEIRELPRD